MEGLYTAADDVTLVREIAAGSEDALAALYDRHAGAVFAAASRLTTDRQVAEEVVQETFLAVWNRADTFDPAAGSLPAWLYTIARNRTVDRLRAIGRRPRLVSPNSIRNSEEPESFALDRLASIGVVVGGAARDGGPEGALAAAELRSTLRDALAAMPDTGEDRHRPGLPGRPEPVRDRRAARLAARHRQDPDSTRPLPVA